MTCAICGCRDDDACPEVCSWAMRVDVLSMGPMAADVPICSSCVRLAEELGRRALELAGRRSTARLSAETVGWHLLTWLALEPDGPGAVLDRWAQSEPWSAEAGGLLEGRKVWWRARGSKGPRPQRRRKGVAK